MVGGTHKDIEKRKADQVQGAQKTAEAAVVNNLAQMGSEQQNEQARRQYAQENYMAPPLEQAETNLTRDLNELNPEIGNTELVPQFVNLLKITRTQTGEAARQASMSLASVMDLLKRTKGIKLTPIWQGEIKKVVSLVKKQQAEPKNKKIAMQLIMRSGTIAENNTAYLEIQKTDIPKERIDAFMDKRADTAARIMDEGLAAGLSIDEIEKRQREARKEDVKEFLIQARKDGYEVPQEVVEKLEIFIDIADKRSELYDAGAYAEASRAASYAEYAGVLGNAGLGFAINPPSLLDLEAGEEEMGADAAAQAQMMQDLQSLANEEQKQAEEAQKLIEDLMAQAEKESEETTVGDLKDDELKERLEKMGVEQDKTIKQVLEFTKKTMETVSVQQGRVDTLKQNAVVGLEPSFHENPQEVLEMNGIMKDGKLTEFGQSVMPDILRASGGSFNNALNQIMDAIPMDGREEFMERTEEARVVINEYLANPGNAEMREAAAEILVNPEFVAIRAAFNEALADNAAEIIGRLNA